MKRHWGCLGLVQSAARGHSPHGTDNEGACQKRVAVDHTIIIIITVVVVVAVVRLQIAPKRLENRFSTFSQFLYFFSFLKKTKELHSF